MFHQTIASALCSIAYVLPLFNLPILKPTYFKHGPSPLGYLGLVLISASERSQEDELQRDQNFRVDDAEALYNLPFSWTRICQNTYRIHAFHTFHELKRHSDTDM